jgi:hypothetical protein
VSTKIEIARLHDQPSVSTGLNRTYIPLISVVVLVHSGLSSSCEAGSQRTLCWRGESTANSSLKLGADSGRVMDDSGTVKCCFPLEFRRKLSSLPWQRGSALRQLSPCDYVRFWRWAPSASMNLPSIKRAGSPHYTVIRLKTSFCSATYRPKERRPIYRELGALVHSKYLYHSVSITL